MEETGLLYYHPEINALAELLRNDSFAELVTPFAESVEFGIFQFRYWSGRINQCPLDSGWHYIGEV